MKKDLERWNPVWGEQLHLWTSSVVPRSTGTIADKYWQPPGFPASFRGLRSRSDLRKFLDCCSQYQVTVASGGGNVVDYLAAMQLHEQQIKNSAKK
jgi:hypothetical protein